MGHAAALSTWKVSSGLRVNWQGHSHFQGHHVSRAVIFFFFQPTVCWAYGWPRLQKSWKTAAVRSSFCSQGLQLMRCPSCFSNHCHKFAHRPKNPGRWIPKRNWSRLRLLRRRALCTSRCVSPFVSVTVRSFQRRTDWVPVNCADNPCSEFCQHLSVKISLHSYYKFVFFSAPEEEVVRGQGE